MLSPLPGFGLQRLRRRKMGLEHAVLDLYVVFDKRPQHRLATQLRQQPVGLGDKRVPEVEADCDGGPEITGEVNSTGRGEGRNPVGEVHIFPRESVL